MASGARARCCLVVADASRVGDQVVNLLARHVMVVRASRPPARFWTAAAVVIVVVDGLEVAAELPRRRGVVVVGPDLGDATIWSRAVSVAAEHVISLPEAAEWLVGHVAAAVAADDGMAAAG